MVPIAPAARWVIRRGTNRLCVQNRRRNCRLKYLIRIIMYFFYYKMSRFQKGITVPRTAWQKAV